MRTRYVIFLALFLFFGVSFVEAEELTPLKDTKTFEQKLTRFGEQTESLQSSFVQEKKMRLFSKPVTSEGIFYFKKPNRVNLTYTKPTSYRMIIDDSFLYTISTEEHSKVALKGNKMLSQVGTLIEASMVGNISLLKRDFEMKCFSSSTAYQVRLYPKSSAMKQYLKEVVITFEKQEMYVIELNIVEGNSDTTRYKFFNHKMNGIEDDSHFTAE